MIRSKTKAMALEMQTGAFETEAGTLQVDLFCLMKCALCKEKQEQVLQTLCSQGKGKRTQEDSQGISHRPQRR